MRELCPKELLCISGGDDETESMLDGLLIGVTTGSLAGASACAYFLYKRPMLLVVPGLMENAVKFSALAGAFAGGLIGAFAGVAFCD